MTKYQKIELPNNDSLLHNGPPLSQGPLPSVFYMAVAAEESLTIPPFNHPVSFLSQSPIRIFSMTLPHHGQNFDKKTALQNWAASFEKGENIILNFTQRVVKALDYLIDNHIILSDKIALMGLSRGFLPAMVLAAKDPRPNILLGFAPLINPLSCKEFQNMGSNTIIKSLKYNKLAEKLTDKKIRLHIGNKDMRVGSKNAFLLIEQIIERTSFAPQVEMVMTPSIGYLGHGTSLESFRTGTTWLLQNLLPETLYEI